jgi:hypothetical protein
MVTRSPRAFSSIPREEIAIPLPSDDTTPPVTKINFTLFLAMVFSFMKLKMSVAESE